jgi:hypothetical protein
MFAPVTVKSLSTEVCFCSSIAARSSPSSVREKKRYVRCSLLFAAYHQHGAVGVADYGIGDAAHKGPPNPAATSAAHDYQSSAYFFSHGHNLYTGVSFPKVSPRNFSPGVLDFSDLPIEQGSGFSSRRFWLWFGVTTAVGVRDRQDAMNVDHVQF